MIQNYLIYYQLNELMFIQKAFKDCKDLLPKIYFEQQTTLRQLDESALTHIFQQYHKPDNMDIPCYYYYHGKLSQISKKYDQQICALAQELFNRGYMLLIFNKSTLAVQNGKVVITKPEHLIPLEYQVMERITEIGYNNAVEYMINSYITDEEPIGEDHIPHIVINNA